MIHQTKLKFGQASGSATETVQAIPVNVFVDPNYSGESKTLEEVNRYCRTGRSDGSDVIIDELAFSALTPSSLMAEAGSILRMSP